MIVDPIRSVPPRWFSLAALILFIPIALSFAIKPRPWWNDYPGILFHLAMFGLVAKLDAPDWAKAAGYGWLFLDVTTGIMTLNNVPMSTAIYVRLGGHIFGGVWLIVASLSGSRSMKVVGSIAGIWLIAYSFVSPFVPIKALGPQALLVLVWLAIVSWRYGRTSNNSDHLPNV